MEAGPSGQRRKLTVPAAHDLEILPRVLALGTDAELLSPSAARQRLHEILQQMNQAYEKR